MKKYIFLLMTVGFFYACDKEDDNPINNSELIGEWNLIEVYADPGGGGTFEPVESDKRVTFHADGTISSNGDLCNMSITTTSTTTGTTGTYSLSDSTFSSTSCVDPDYDYAFEQTGDILIITYPCIEPCQMKYKKN